METDTNPVDRSIAHLLFHRPSDSASTPVNDSSAFRSPSMVYFQCMSSSHMIISQQFPKDVLWCVW